MVNKMGEDSQENKVRKTGLSQPFVKCSAHFGSFGFAFLGQFEKEVIVEGEKSHRWND